jgi:hypothetical protein
MSTLRTLAAGTLFSGAAALTPLAQAAPAAAANETLRFQVYLDDKPIGEHTYRISGSGEQVRVSSRAEFDVDFLFINAYRYRHRSQEVFRDGCLEEIRASTDDNGTRYEVTGEAAGERFRIQRDDGTEQAKGCVMTFAYWDPDFLDQSRLLNPQTGELERVQVSRKGRDRIEVGGREVPAERYVVDAGEVTIDLWYNEDLGWVGLSSDTGKGRRIIYRRL